MYASKQSSYDRYLSCQLTSTSYLKNLFNINYSNIKFKRSYSKSSKRRNLEICMTPQVSLLCHIANKIMVCELFWVLKKCKLKISDKEFFSGKYSLSGSFFKQG